MKTRKFLVGMLIVVLIVPITFILTACGNRDNGNGGNGDTTHLGVYELTRITVIRGGVTTVTNRTDITHSHYKPVPFQSTVLDHEIIPNIFIFMELRPNNVMRLGDNAYHYDFQYTLNGNVLVQVGSEIFPYTLENDKITLVINGHGTDRLTVEWVKQDSTNNPLENHNFVGTWFTELGLYDWTQTMIVSTNGTFGATQDTGTGPRVTFVGNWNVNGNVITLTYTSITSHVGTMEGLPPLNTPLTFTPNFSNNNNTITFPAGSEFGNPMELVFNRVV